MQAGWLMRLLTQEVSADTPFILDDELASMQHARVHPVTSLGVPLELWRKTCARCYSRSIGSRRHVIGTSGLMILCCSC